MSAALDALAATVRADGGLLADTVTDPTEDARLGELAGAGYEELVEAIYEGYLQHYGEGRVLRPRDPDLALLAAIGELSPDDPRALYKLGVRLGPLDIFLPALLKPTAQFLRAALLAVRQGQPLPRLPAPGAATLSADCDPRGAALAYRRFGRQWIRIDLADQRIGAGLWLTVDGDADIDVAADGIGRAGKIVGP